MKAKLLILATVLSVALLTSCEIKIVQNEESLDTSSTEFSEADVSIENKGSSSEEKTDKKSEKNEKNEESSKKDTGNDKASSSDKTKSESEKKNESSESVSDNKQEAESSSKPDKNSSESSSEPVKENKTEADKDNKYVSEKTLRKLVDKSLDCLYNLELSTPRTVGEPIGNEDIYQVDTAVFKDYDDFQDYFASIYCQNFMDTVINALDSTDSNQKYFCKDGMLCVNYKYSGSKGYYVDWSDYTIEIVSASATECEFILTATIEEPADNPVKESYSKTFRAVCENGEWRLTASIY